MIKTIFTFLLCIPLFGFAQSRTGKDYAIFFAVTDFRSGWATLDQTITDAQKIAQELNTRYGFDTKIFQNPDGKSILEELAKLGKQKFTKDDQLLIFFSMHGYLNEISSEGFLIPANGSDPRNKGAEKTWLAHATVKKAIESIPNVHILVAIDACYSGAFSGVKSKPGDGSPCGDYCYCRIQQALSSATRYYVTAGAKEVVPSNSGFAKQWLTALGSNGKDDGILTFAELYTYLETISPMPRWGTMTGHEQGNFVFVSKMACGGAPPPPPGDPANFALIYVDGSTFEMGDQFNEGDSDEFPVHSVTLNDFWMDPTEITFETYDMFCQETDRQRPFDSGQGRGQKPVINISWYDAIEFCNWRSLKMGLEPCYAISKRPPDPNNENQDDLKKLTITWLRSAKGFRLPTEAEWEYAARSNGRKIRYGTGKDDANSNSINCSWNENEVTKTKNSGSLISNALGLYNMSGNVSEWCWDWYDGGYYNRRDRDNPDGPGSGKLRVVRGGNYFNSAFSTRAAARSGERADLTSMGIGFRCVRSR